jgi:hypothetical protein
MFKLEIETKTEAFYWDQYNPWPELARILHKLASRRPDGETEGAIKDGNGKYVGIWTLTSGDAPDVLAAARYFRDLSGQNNAELIWAANGKEFQRHCATIADATARKHSRPRKDRKIVVVMDGGIIQDIDGIPAGMAVEVRDFDTEGCTEGDLTMVGDPLGPALVTVWGYHPPE